MCYYNGQKVTTDEFIRLKRLEKMVARYPFLNRDVISGFDFGNTAVLVPSKDGGGNDDFALKEMEWGFIPDPMVWPFWETRDQVNQGRVPHKDHYGKFVDGLNFLNAISEEVLKKGKVYRQAALTRPCLFLSSGYYEWRHIFPLNKRTKEPRKIAEKYPYRIFLADREYFFIAGIWQEWMDAETGEVVETCSMLTTAGNEVASEIHNSKKRQPTVLTDDLAYEWLFGERTEKMVQEIASFQIPYEQMRYYTLKKDFLNSFDPLKPHYYPDLPALNVPGGDLNTAAPTGDQQLGLF
ncbi:SOS response-associated peptidase [Niabella sp. CJ426]|uniref:SOS response-associated peptidase n=1 Tax=Niabella sp. CJ426 TaxID=3393740 RepID=UPI003CFE278E